MWRLSQPSGPTFKFKQVFEALDTLTPVCRHTQINIRAPKIRASKIIKIMIVGALRTTDRSHSPELQGTLFIEIG